MVTRLKLNTLTGEASFGSGNPQTIRGEGDFTAEEIAAAKPLTTQEYGALMADPRAKSDPMDPRPAAKFRREAEAGLIRGMQLAEMGQALASESMSTVDLVMQADSSIPRAIAEAGVQAGPWINHEERQLAYSDPRYAKSESYRAYVSSRETVS